jgi:hypothetical protein
MLDLYMLREMSRSISVKSNMKEIFVLVNVLYYQ